MSNNALNMYNQYTKMLEEKLNYYSDEYIQAEILLNVEMKQLFEEYIDYISKNEKYYIIKDGEIYIKNKR